MGDKIPLKLIKFKKNVVYVILFEKQFDVKIFKTDRNGIYIKNVDYNYDFFLISLFINFLKITLKINLSRLFLIRMVIWLDLIF